MILEKRTKQDRLCEDSDIWNSEDETSFLIASFVKFKQAKKFLEIGTYKGNTTIEVVRHNKNVAVVTLDIKDFFSSILKKLPGGEKKRISYVLGTSSDIKLRSPEHFDFAYIDAEHHFLTCLLDLIHTIEVIEPNGTIVMHDTLNTHLPGVGRTLLLFQLINVLCLGKIASFWTMKTKQPPGLPNNGITFIFFHYLTQKKKYFVVSSLRTVHTIVSKAHKLLSALRK